MSTPLGTNTEALQALLEYIQSENFGATTTAEQLMNRTNAVNVANSNYTTLMARGTSLHSSETNPAVNGAIAWTYE